MPAQGSVIQVGRVAHSKCTNEVVACLLLARCRRWCWGHGTCRTRCRGAPSRCCLLATTPDLGCTTCRCWCGRAVRNSPVHRTECHISGAWVPDMTALWLIYLCCTASGMLSMPPTTLRAAAHATCSHQLQEPCALHSVGKGMPDSRWFATCCRSSSCTCGASQCAAWRTLATGEHAALGVQLSDETDFGRTSLLCASYLHTGGHGPTHHLA
jgi:hypothetical protein